MKKMKVCCLYAVCLVMVLFLLHTTGCVSQPVARTESPAAYLTLTDDAGRVVVLLKQPERIVPLSASFVDLLYAVGGKAVGKPSATTGSLPSAAQALPSVGHVANINAEQLLRLSPDLVIGFQGMHEKLIPILESSNIPFMIIRLRTYDDVQDKIKLFGDLSGTQQQAASVAELMRSRIKAITDQAPQTGKSVAILHATANGVTVQLDQSIAGNIARMLRLNNIASGSTAAAMDAAPYSMEKLVEGDPDIVLITYMGNMADIEKRLWSDVKSNPAWNGLRAVKNEQVFFLPMELFLLNPGIRFDAAVSYMAKLVYPEIFPQ